MNKWYKSKPVRLIALLILSIAGIALGYMRWTYALVWDNGFKLTMRFAFENYNYPNDWLSLIKSIQHDPRWLSFIFYSTAPFLLSIAVIYFSFLNKDYIKQACYIYVFSWSIVLLLSLISLLFHSYSIGIGLAQNFKQLLQTPFFTLLLLSGFKVTEVLKKEKGA